MKAIPLALTAALILGAVAVEPAQLEIRAAHAVVGRPLTPVSYAGVARRTARRTTRRNVGYGGYGGYGAGYVAGAATATAITTLPSGCVFGAGMYTCGAIHYRPYYQGTTIVYQVVQ